ncbi:hypothetical protein MY9_0864 [Bacillus sp. JS]|nr:hypothetical protein MY9_0864 [Bacillus sp. JS]
MTGLDETDLLPADLSCLQMAIERSHPFYIPSSMSKGLCFSIYGK